MTMSRTDPTGLMAGGRSLVALACLLLAGCASGEPTGSATASAGPTGSAPESSGAATDWSNTTYTVTCDGIVPDGFPATVVDGSARVPADASRPPHYDHYDIRVLATASG